ncbi:HAD-IA family hydrolase [Blastococcus sp. Marseille-P5729]|uniref:HAD-IA family hydrolase n=1 Tax=Blastococcus sp. Marseille-P5729 TaxID=2086582 RepID=UPI000D106874|nr:HAD-IA family hydrolase [Blastococcus sp. Marseille-P5729]
MTAMHGAIESPTDELVYTGYTPEHEMLRETLTSTGNGYFCTRGTLEWEDANEVHYPGTYSHGIFNRETTILSGRPVLNEDMVNLPNWLTMKLSIDGGEPFHISKVKILDYTHRMELASNLMVREIRFADRHGRITKLVSRRFVSMRRIHQAGISWDLTAENYSGRLTVISGINGVITNAGVERYKALQGRHLAPLGPRVIAPDTIGLKAQTRQSQIEIAQAARTRVYRGDEEMDVERDTFQIEDYIHQTLSFDITDGETVRVEKMVSVFNSHDRAINEPMTQAGKVVTRYGRFDQELSYSANAWEELWAACNIELPSDERVQFLLRLHICHLMQVCSRNTPHQDAGVPARGLNGEAYRGHIFWDEMYVFPFLNFRLPAVTDGLLMYRFRRLGEARAAAADLGLKGAMFPWQSGSDGQEETQVVHLNPMSGQWDPDLSRNQRHVNAAIFYNIWSYYQATDDFQFLRDSGAEMMLEIARFWASLAHFNPERERWEIHGVMGPDEFHEKYPGADEGGLRNNAYTNVMVAWICEVAQQVLHLLPGTRRLSLMHRIGLTEEEVAQWKDMSHRMFVPFHRDGILSQFEGYEDLAELDWDAYREKYGDIQRLDRILKAEDDDPDRYKLAKQADAVMLFYLFPLSTLTRIFARLGYRLDEDLAKRTIDYYDRRTSHGSTLSWVTHAGVLASLDPDSSWERFKVALESDIGDIQGGTTREGIHLGVMAGTLDLVQRAYLGTDVRHGVLHINPTQLDHLHGLRLRMQFRGATLAIAIDGNELRVTSESEGQSHTVRIGVGDEIVTLARGETSTFVVDGRPVEHATPGFAAVIFDIDGLLVDSPHELSWRGALEDLMTGEWSDVAGQTSYSPEAFDDRVYQEVVAGRPRIQGALAALRYFGVPDAERRAKQYADLKQHKLVQLIDEGEFQEFDDALRFLVDVKNLRIPIAAASSSKNAQRLMSRIDVSRFLQRAGIQTDAIKPGTRLSDVFDANLSGRDYIHGKPDPEIFLTAAAALGVTPSDCLVLEDAAAGVTAGKAAGMCVIGVARLDDEDLLTSADLVVASLDQVDREQLAQGVLAAS